jgi:ankyrin repeat protein
MLRCLVAAGADVNAKNARKESALHLAARSDAASVALLLAAKADPRVVATKGKSALMAAVSCVDALTLLIRAGAPLNAKDSPQRRTALHHALIAKRFDAAKLLIEAGCDVKSSDSAGMNPITLAAIARATDIVALLESREAGPITNYHVSAALSWSDLTAIPLLRERGMRPTPADWFASSGSPQLMRELLRAGADVNWTDRRGRTILDTDYTVSVGSLQVLAEHGFNFSRTGVMFYNSARQASYALSLLEVAPELIETRNLFATLIWCTKRMRVILACGYDVVGQHIERNYTGIDEEHQALLYACGAASIAHCGDRPNNFTGTREQFLQTPNGASLLAKAQRDVARERVDLIRERATTICIGLQDLALPAWVTVQILLQACAPFANCVRLWAIWEVARRTKHFRGEQQQ